MSLCLFVFLICEVFVYCLVLRLCIVFMRFWMLVVLCWELFLMVVVWLFVLWVCRRGVWILWSLVLISLEFFKGVVFVMLVERRYCWVLVCWFLFFWWLFYNWLCCCGFFIFYLLVFLRFCVVCLRYRGGGVILGCLD